MEFGVLVSERAHWGSGNAPPPWAPNSYQGFCPSQLVAPPRGTPPHVLRPPVQLFPFSPQARFLYPQA